MSKLTLEELKKLRDEQKRSMDLRETGNKDVEITVGMGTSGIAAGAKDTFRAFSREVAKFGLNNVKVKQTGSLGMDHAEPLVEVKMDGMPDTFYGKMDETTVRRVIEDHILNGKLVDSHVFDKPSPDILED